MDIRRHQSINEKDVLALYRSVGWTNYTDNAEMLLAALKGSLAVYSAYVDDKLVGLLRVAGDGASILFIQDILVLPHYQRRGIGSALLQALIEDYPSIYQMHLLTDQSDQTKCFYESQGFIAVDKVACRAFTYQRRKTHTD